MCLVASSDPGITDAAGVGAAVLLQAMVPPRAAGTDVARSGPGARRRTCSGKDTPTLTVMVMGRRVNRLSRARIPIGDERLNEE